MKHPLIDPTSRPFAWRNNTARRLWLLLWAVPVLLPLRFAWDFLVNQRDAARVFLRSLAVFIRAGWLPVLRFAWKAPCVSSAQTK